MAPTNRDVKFGGMSVSFLSDDEAHPGDPLLGHGGPAAADPGWRVAGG